MQHSNKTTIFADGVENIGVVSGVVRADLFQITLNENIEETAEKSISGQLLMSPEGFSRTLQSFVRLFEELKAKGLVSDSTITE